MKKKHQTVGTFVRREIIILGLIVFIRAPRFMIFFFFSCLKMVVVCSSVQS